MNYQKEAKLKELIEKGSNIGGSVSGAVIGLVLGGPIGAISGAAVGPLLTDSFKKIGIELSNKFLGNREEMRVGATFSLAINKIDQEIKNGKRLRNKEFYEASRDDRSSAETIIEGTLLKARNEYEEKKITYYSNLLANLNFDNSITFEHGNTLLRITEQLSYRQLAIVAYFNKKEVLNTLKWSISFSRIDELSKYLDFYSDIMDLYNQQLLQQTGDGIFLDIIAIKLSPLGKSLFRLLELQYIKKIEINVIENTIAEVNDIIQSQNTNN